MAPRILVCCLAGLALAGCGSDEDIVPGKPAPVTQLTVRLDPDGTGPRPAGQARIFCDAGANGRACTAAAKLRPADLEPVAGDVACAGLFGGPQTATISGVLDRRAVDARFARNNSCEIARWEKVAPLLDAAG